MSEVTQYGLGFRFEAFGWDVPIFGFGVWCLGFVGEGLGTWENWHSARCPARVPSVPACFGAGSYV